MNRRTASMLALASMLAAPQARAQAGAVDVSGVSYAPTVSLGGSNLLLNGAGVRYKFVIKVYTAGLYLTGKAGTTEGVLAAPGPKRLHVVMLRDIDANELGKLFTRGMQDNSSREEFGKSIAGTLRLAEMFAAKKKLSKGESFSVDWVPGVGTTIVVNGQPQGEPVKEPEFLAALLRIWLGPNPADDQLKQLLLGHAPRSLRERR